MAGHQIHEAWYDEALLLDTNGFVAEGPGENIFFVRDNILYTPSERNILPWITRSTIMTLAKEILGISVQEVNILVDEIKEYREAFFVWTAAEVTPIASITDETWCTFTFSSEQTDSLTQKIKILYHDIIHGKMSTYTKWLR